MTQAKPAQRQDGFILIVVLGVVLLLCALLFGFSQTTRTSLAKADSFYRTEQAWNAAWGGLQIAVAAIRDVNAVCSDPQSAKLTTSENTFTVGDVNCTVAITPEPAVDTSTVCGSTSLTVGRATRRSIASGILESIGLVRQCWCPSTTGSWTSLLPGTDVPDLGERRSRGGP